MTAAPKPVDSAPGTPESVVSSVMSWANALTLLRVALVPVIVVLLLTDGRTARWWAFGVFLFAALTDSVDGWVARRAGVTRWGELADPAADKALITTALAALAVSGELPWWAVAVIVVREVAVTVRRSGLARRGRVLPATKLGKAKTVSQIAAVTLYLLPGVSRWMRLTALGVTIALTLYSGAEYLIRGERLSRAG